MINDEAHSDFDRFGVSSGPSSHCSSRMHAIHADTMSLHGSRCQGRPRLLTSDGRRHDTATRHTRQVTASIGQ
jgi:hypothetical protein